MTLSGGQARETNQKFRLVYETLRALLNQNNGALQVLGDLEADLNHLRASSDRIRKPVLNLLDTALLMAQECNMLTRNRHRALYDVILRIKGEVRNHLESARNADQGPLTVTLDSEAALDPTLAGGKAAGLAAVGRLLGESVPPGLVLTTSAYRALLQENGLVERIRILLKDIEVTLNAEAFRARTSTVRAWIRDAKVPEGLERKVREYTDRMAGGIPVEWAVRSSAVFEGETHSFAGLFTSELHIPTEKILSAYLNVVASRFLDRAVMYRIHRGIREVECPMAVLILPMIAPAASGVIYSADPKNPEEEVMLIHALAGLGDKVSRGAVTADGFTLSRGERPRVLDAVPAAGSCDSRYRPDYISERTLCDVGALAFRARKGTGHDLDMEWAVDGEGRIHVLQARRIVTPDPPISDRGRRSKDLPLIEGGITISPGRAEGPLVRLETGAALETVPRGAVLLVDQPGPELAPLLPKLAALLAVEGHPVGHLATLAREFSVPSLFRVPSTERLDEGGVISVDATARRIHGGSRWPGMRDRVLARLASGKEVRRSGPLHDLILSLNLTDPDASSFKASRCRSLHDTIRFMHEMSVRSFFAFGDRQRKGWNKNTLRLDTALPVKFFLVHLDRAAFPKKKSLPPEEVNSLPFQAFWNGFSGKELHWPERWRRAMMGLPRDFQETVLGGDRGPRRTSDANFIMVGSDYFNLNARFAYHYSMIDAIVGEGTEHNHVYFTFRGGGASTENRVHRATFLERVLRQSHFAVDRRVDNLAAWMRRFPRNESEAALECLGRLLVCARQLDAVLSTDALARRYADDFLAARYEVFA